MRWVSEAARLRGGRQGVFRLVAEYFTQKAVRLRGGLQDGFRSEASNRQKEGSTPARRAAGSGRAPCTPGKGLRPLDP